jgi:hypothetical protein
MSGIGRLTRTSFLSAGSIGSEFVIVSLSLGLTCVIDRCFDSRTTSSMQLNVQLIMYVRRTQPQFHFPWESSCWPGVGVPTGIHKSSWGGPAAPWLLGPAVVCCVPAVPPPRRGRTGTGVPMPAASAGVRHRHRHPKPPRHQHGGTVRGD